MVRVREQEGDLFLDMGTILHYIEFERARGRQSFPLTRSITGPD
jgi:hypothetical protein